MFYRIPPLVRLDTLPNGRGDGWRLTPDITYPYAHEFRGFPMWRVLGDSARLTWSNGFTPTVVTLGAADSALVGTAVALSDVHRVGEPPRPRARVVLRRRSCDGA